MNIKKSIRHYYYGLFILDLFAWTFAFICSYWIRHYNQFPHIPSNYLIIIPYMLIVYSLIFRYFGLYRSDLKRISQFFHLAKAEFLGLGILLALSFFYRGFSYSRIVVISFLSIIFCLNFLSRHIYRLALQKITEIHQVEGPDFDSRRREDREETD